jgi:hypothetical protein
MYQQYRQIERYHLVTMQDNLQRELSQISASRQAEACRDKRSTFQNLLASTGWKLVQIGTRLVERHSLTNITVISQGDCDLYPQTDTRAAGLV